MTQPPTSHPNPDGSENGEQPLISSTRVAITQISPDGTDPRKHDNGSRRVLDEIFVDVSPRSFAERDGTPYSDDDANCWVGRATDTPIRLDELLTHALAPIGYVNVAKLTYRATWSPPEVEHILTFDTYGTPRTCLTGEAGLRNRSATAFAEQCRLRYENNATRDASGYRESPWLCPSRFSIGTFFGWRPRSSLYTEDYSLDQLTRKLQETIQFKLVPYVRDITTLSSFLTFLERDEEPMRWCLGAHRRAALVAFLAHQIGVPRNKTRALLLTHARLMGNGIDERRLTPETYIQHILDDAECAPIG